MTNKEKIKDLLAKSSNGIITSDEVTAAGLHRSGLQELVADGVLCRYERGLYVLNNVLEDEIYLLQCKYEKGIYSHDTALYLWGYSDRTPINYTMTFPKGYNSQSLKKENINIKRAIPDNYSLGVVEIETPSGNLVRTYDLERTLCDILRGSGSDIQIVNAAMKRYAVSKEKDIHKLMKYADKLRVKPKILRYMEVLL